jgi:hypothetical protein
MFVSDLKGFSMTRYHGNTENVAVINQVDLIAGGQLSRQPTGLREHQNAALSWILAVMSQ